MVGTTQLIRCFSRQKTEDEPNGLGLTHETPQQLGPTIRPSALHHKKGVNETHASSPNNQAVGSRLPPTTGCVQSVAQALPETLPVDEPHGFDPSCF